LQFLDHVFGCGCPCPLVAHLRADPLAAVAVTKPGSHETLLPATEVTAQGVNADTRVVAERFARYRAVREQSGHSAYFIQQACVVV
jgi:hypothetical protein